MQPRAVPEPPTPVLGPPLVEVEAVLRCEICGSVEHERVASGYDYELETCGNLWWFVRCPACEHVWLHPRPAASALPTIYPPSYYAYGYDDQIGAVARWGKSALDRLKLGGILGALKRRPSSYLDVGCGNGRFLKAMEARGVEKSSLYGLELDGRVVEKLHGEGFQVFCERVEGSESIPPNSIDLITMFHVIEHLDAPARVLERLTSWLAPGGVLALETPNIDSWDARLFRTHYWGGYHIPRHWHLFKPETLTRLLARAGLEVSAVRYQTGHAFWLYSLHHRLKYGTRRRPRLARFFDPFTNLVPLLLASATNLRLVPSQPRRGARSDSHIRGEFWAAAGARRVARRVQWTWVEAPLLLFPPRWWWRLTTFRPRSGPIRSSGTSSQPSGSRPSKPYRLP
jgi:SAM-dependent methyltransferase